MIEATVYCADRDEYDGRTYVVAAVGPLSQVLQIPAVFLVDRTGLRKAMVVVSSFLSRLSWIIVASLPWLVPAEQRVTVLLACLFLYFGLGTISGCAFNSWMRDLVPEQIMGRYFGKRLAVATAVGAALSLLAGIGLEAGKGIYPNHLVLFSVLFVVGAAAGLLGVHFLARVPEPKMVPPPARGMLSALVEPFKEFNFRRLLFFLGSWSFAVNLAAPFFVVYMLTRLGMNMAVVLAFSVLSQVVNVLFLRVWGRLADRLSNKSVLTVSGPLFMISIVLWPFLTLPEKHMLTMPLLVAIHVLAGMSTAGVALCAGNVALKAAPKGRATAFLAANALISGLAATAATVIAGFGADWFAGQNLRLSILRDSTFCS